MTNEGHRREKRRTTVGDIVADAIMDGLAGTGRETPGEGTTTHKEKMAIWPSNLDLPRSSGHLEASV